ncbi:4'-phosphopantetheinyl transferase superfamily protein [Weissella confusa]|uniref:4'-phosphopantetheinyl transferase superfamily protein n=1 Tax=Weissella confusa TaxID=1583 RepID=A0A923NHE0_WEICO|nr:4'-phosphopantetheinyl transferase superfamily protein [Weissella confusa]
MVKHPKQDEAVAHISISHTGDTVHSSVILESLASLHQPVSERRPAWLEISESALAHNVAYIRELGRPKFIDVILTPAEREVFDKRKGKHQMEFLAGRFSIKEAYSKAIGTGIGGDVHWHDLEIVPNESGQVC